LGLDSVPPWLIIAAALACTILVGRFMADGRIKDGVAIVFAACFAPLVFFDLILALGVWVAVLFFTDLSVLSSGPNAIAVLVTLAWLGTFLAGRRGITLLHGHRRLLLLIIGFCLWATLSVAWASRPGDAGSEAAYWWLAGLVFLVLLTTLRNFWDVNVIVLAFVAGAVISVLIGIATGSLSASDTAMSQTAIQGRFTGGGGDPNVQAAGFVAAMFLILGLLSVYRTSRARIALTAAFVTVGLGFFATESRGGLVALLIGTVAALFIAPRQRRQILRLLFMVAAAGAILVAATPGSLTRITDISGGTSGRSDLWRVAWEVFKSHPVVGVGVGNFQVVENHYVLRPGAINRIQYITDVPYLVHNTYLQFLAETGVIGLLAFLVVVIAVLVSAYQAARRLDLLGERRQADLTRAIMMGTIGMLSALFFITDGDDQRLWVLMALGPVMLGVARRLERERKSPAPG
jgi:O-antigen ligase